MKSLTSGWCLAVLSLICNLRVSAPCPDDNIEEYYWRHYNGTIPRDALLGGQDEEGNPTYIGQTVYMTEYYMIIPGYIKEAEQRMYFEYGDTEHTKTENIKILCTQYPEQFEWIRTTIDDIANLAEKNFVCGGYEFKYTVYIGRLQVNEELAIGKVIVTHERARGFHTTSNGTFFHTKQFEVLNYDPDIPTIDEIRKSLDTPTVYINSAKGSKSTL